MLVTGFPYDLRQNPDNNLALFAHLAQRSLAVRRFGAAALDLAYVAAGRLDCLESLEIPGGAERAEQFAAVPGVVVVPHREPDFADIGRGRESHDKQLDERRDDQQAHEVADAPDLGEFLGHHAFDS